MLELITLAVIGAGAGYFIGNLRKDKGFGVPGNCLLGVLGALAAAFFLSLLGGLLGLLITALIGTIILFWGLGKLRKPEPNDPFPDDRYKNL